MIQLKRAYDEPAKDDGLRILVDRLWPRGVSKVEAHIDEWLKDVAPTPALRTWFGHDPERWAEFRRRYTAELKQRTEAIAELRDLISGKRVTFVYGAKDRGHTHAIVLKDFVEHTARKRAAKKKKPATKPPRKAPRKAAPRRSR